ncbi:cell wall hydrolase [Stappia sp. F7233]|uniref:Cell wall hydrolase n=2 Tax=Stappia albiluteola TaxID=2758565 RepID=A0A839ALF8_9HYPH|nr:cell wall hydrolase [Stappia albiluteola]
MTALEAANHQSSHAPTLIMADASRPDLTEAPDIAVTSAAPGHNPTVVRGLENFVIDSAPKTIPDKIEINRSRKGNRHLSMAPDREMVGIAAGTVYSLPNLFAEGPEQDLPRVAFVKPITPLTGTGKGSAVAHVDGQGRPLDLMQLAIARNAAATSLSLAAAYAPNALADTNAPFRALLGQPQIDDPAAQEEAALEANKDGDPYWWVKRPLPASVNSSKEQRCLAEAVYFEARGEPETGQVAVAQVVLNRVRNPAYPDTICKVVYQNRHKRNRCQFSFACDGIRDRISSKAAWETAQRVAKDAVDGDEYIEDVGASTHYHATYVKPRWARSMKRLDKIGRHIFYRTRGGGWS